MNIKPLYQKAKNLVIDNVVDSTVVATIANPFFGINESLIARMPKETMRNARFLGMILAYGGLGLLLSKGRNFSRKIFKITQKSPESIQKKHDFAYTVGFNLFIGPLFYAAAGARTFKEFAVGTTAGVAFGCLGPYIGYSIDAFRDLIGIEESPRLPPKIKNLSPRAKKTLAAGIVAGSLAITYGLYSICPTKAEYEARRQERQQTIEIQDQRQQENLLEQIVDLE